MKTTYFGLTSYSKSLGIQDQALKLVEQTGFPVVLGFEFYPVVALGARKSLADQKITQENLEDQGVEVLQTPRSSPLSVHAPGQLVIYPLVPYAKLKLPPELLTDLLKEATLLWLKKYQIAIVTDTKPLTLSTSKGEIAQIGLETSQGISRYGVSISISNDLDLFDQFVKSDSVFSHDVDLDLKEAFDEWNLYWTYVLLQAVPNPK